MKKIFYFLVFYILGFITGFIFDSKKDKIKKVIKDKKINPIKKLERKYINFNK